jgi:hypothetical protein
LADSLLDAGLPVSRHFFWGAQMLELVAAEQHRPTQPRQGLKFQSFPKAPSRSEAKRAGSIAGDDPLDRTPLQLHPELRLSPALFALRCEANPDGVLEAAAS